MIFLGGEPLSYVGDCPTSGQPPGKPGQKNFVFHYLYCPLFVGDPEN